MRFLIFYVLTILVLLHRAPGLERGIARHPSASVGRPPDRTQPQVAFVRPKPAEWPRVSRPHFRSQYPNRRVKPKLIPNLSTEHGTQEIEDETDFADRVIETTRTPTSNLHEVSTGRIEDIDKPLVVEDRVASSTPNPKIENVTQMLDPDQFVPSTEEENEELLCIFKLYMDSFVKVSKVDMNDRLIFLVPLIIIYWKHRHPPGPFPYIEIDHLLRDVGPEAQVYRLVLRDIANKVESQCSRRQLVLQDPTKKREQDRELEAITVIRSWLDDSASDVDTLNGDRQGGDRESRHWLKDLFKQSSISSRQNQQQDKRVEHPPVEPTTLNLATTSAPGTTNNPLPASSSRHGLMNGIFHQELTTTSNNSFDFVVTTTELYGWPHYEDGRSTRRPQHSFLSEPTASSGGVANPSERADSRSEATSQPMRHNEFFDFVASIMSELKQIDASASSMRNRTAVSPMSG